MPTKELTDQSFESIPTHEKKKPGEEKVITLGRFKIKLKTLFISIGGFFALLILVAVIASRSKPSVPETPRPTPTPTPVEEKVASSSAYATDSAILKIQTELESIEEQLQSTDLKETGLNPPVLDMNIRFEED